MALAACLVGQKRGREAWEDCEDVQELKQHLGRQQQQLQKLGKGKCRPEEDAQGGRRPGSRRDPRGASSFASSQSKEDPQEHNDQHRLTDGLPQAS